MAIEYGGSSGSVPVCVELFTRTGVAVEAQDARSSLPPGDVHTVHAERTRVATVLRQPLCRHRVPFSVVDAGSSVQIDIAVEATCGEIEMKCPLKDLECDMVAREPWGIAWLRWHPSNEDQTVGVLRLERECAANTSDVRSIRGVKGVFWIACVLTT